MSLLDKLNISLFSSPKKDWNKFVDRIRESHPEVVTGTPSLKPHYGATYSFVNAEGETITHSEEYDLREHLQGRNKSSLRALVTVDHRLGLIRTEIPSVSTQIVDAKGEPISDDLYSKLLLDKEESDIRPFDL